MVNFYIDAVGVQMLHYNGIGSSGYTAWDRLHAKEEKSPLNQRAKNVWFIHDKKGQGKNAKAECRPSAKRLP